MDTPSDDGTPYDGLYACYNCDLYHEGNHWVPFERVDALVEKHSSDRDFRVKPYMSRLNDS